MLGLSKKVGIVVAVLSLIVGMELSTSAGVIAHPDLNGFRTFKDTSTGLIWVRVDQLQNTPYSSMKTTVERAGFTAAGLTEVSQLLGSLPLGSGQWQNYSSIMGATGNIIFGGYLGTTSSSSSWGYAYNYSNSWTIRTDASTNGYANTTMGIWAYTAVTVPEPSTMLLSGFAIMSAGFVALRRRKVSASA